MSIGLTLPTEAVSSAHSETQRLSIFERLLLMAGIVEIPLQIDKYLMYHEYDSTFGALAGLNLSVTTVSLIGLYFLWMSKAAVSRQRNSAPIYFGAPMLFYILVLAVSSIVAVNPLLTFAEVFLLVQAYLIFFFLANRIRAVEDLNFCIVCLATTIFVQSLLIFGTASLGSSVWGQRIEIGPLMLSVSEEGRANGSMHSPVLAGSTLAILWLPTVALMFASTNRRLFAIAVVSCAVGLLAIFLTQTRGAIGTCFIGCLLIGGALFARNWLPRWVVPLTVFFGLMSLYPIYHVIQHRSNDEGSAESRIHLSAIAIEMISDQPIIGYGAGNCHIVQQRYANQSKYRAEWFYTIHCKYLLVWIETGLIGLVAFLSVLGRGVWQGFASWRIGHRATAILGIALSAAILGHMMHMLVDIFNSRTQVQTLWVVLGISAATWRLAQQFRDEAAADNTQVTRGLGHVQ